MRWHYKKYEGIALLARKLRNNQTPSEILLWDILRRRNIFGYKFLRQHPIFYRVNNKRIEFFIADFYCAELRIIIELDGKIHEYQKEYDSERDSKLLNKGILVVRIQNDDVNDTSAIHEIIRKFVTQRRTQIAKDSSPSLIV